MPALYQCPRCGRHYQTNNLREVSLSDEEAVAEALREPIERGVNCLRCCAELVKERGRAYERKHCKRLQSAGEGG